MDDNIYEIKSVYNKNREGGYQAVEILGSMLTLSSSKKKLILNFIIKKNEKDVLRKIPIYLDLDEALAFFSNSKEIWQQAMTARSDFLIKNPNGNGFPQAFYTFEPGGTTKAKLAARGQQRKDDKAECRLLKLMPATKKVGIIFQAERGGGIENGGIIAPNIDYNSKDPDIFLRISVSMEKPQFDRLAAIICAYLNAAVQESFSNMQKEYDKHKKSQYQSPSAPQYSQYRQQSQPAPQYGQYGSQQTGQYRQQSQPAPQYNQYGQPVSQYNGQQYGNQQYNDPYFPYN